MNLGKYLTIVLACFLTPVVLWGQTTSNSVGMEFVLIKPGKMTVGEFAPPYPVPDDTVKGKEHPYIMYMGEGRGYTETDFKVAKRMATNSATPGFEVRLKKSYYIGKFEVTQAQWKNVMGSNPAVFQDAQSDNHPVENVTWKQVQRFIKALNKMDPGKHYRLPTEFEWEYAARAGAQKDIPWKDIQTTAQLGGTKTYAVGGKLPNAWGLFDMLGNVWEWVSDRYNEKIFAEPRPKKRGKQHVLKGASFTSDVKNATYMTHAGGPGNGWDVGFRLVMEKQ